MYSVKSYGCEYMNTQVKRSTKPSNPAQLVSMQGFNHRIALIPDGHYFISELGSDRPVIVFNVKKGKIYRD